MSLLARKPRRGNWIWLGGALVAVAVLAGAAVTYAGGDGARTGAGAGAVATARPAGGAGARGTDAGRGLGARRGAGAAGYLAGTPAVAVFYDPGDAVGSCELGPFPARGRYVSLPSRHFGHGAACGSYLTVQGPRGLVRAEVVDLCPGCGANMINLSRAAFAAIANPGPGSARVTYWPDPDPVVAGPIVLRVARSPAGLPTLQVIHNGNPLAALAVARAGIPGAAWVAFTLGRHDIWVAPGRLGAGPFRVRITDDRGHQVLVPRVRLSPEHVVRTRRWMYPSARRHRR